MNDGTYLAIVLIYRVFRRSQTFTELVMPTLDVVCLERTDMSQARCLLWPFMPGV